MKLPHNHNPIKNLILSPTKPATSKHFQLVGWKGNRSLIKKFLSSIHLNFGFHIHDNLRALLIKIYMRNYIPVITLIYELEVEEGVRREGRRVAQKRERAVVNRHPFVSPLSFPSQL